MEEPRDRPLWIPPEPPPPPTGWRRIPYWFRRYGFSITVLLLLAGIAALFYWNPHAPTPAFPPLSSPSTASPSRATTPDRPVAGSARLSVQSRPAGASVWLNGDSLGVTPLIGDSVRAGVYLLSVRHDGFYDTDTVAVVRPGTAPSVQVRLIERAFAAGRSPQSPPSRPARPQPTSPSPGSPPSDSPASGSPDTRASGSGSPTAGSSPGESPSRTAPAAASSPTGSLALASTPAGAAIFLDGAPRGTTPQQIDDLPAGTYAVRIERDGFVPWTDSVAVGAQTVRRIQPELTPQTGTVRILALPWGTIYVNDALHTRNADIWVSTTLPVGTHDVTAVHPALGRQTRTVTVAPGTTSLTIDLRRPPSAASSDTTAASSDS
jgi:hypothetical protein